ncbi:tRNA 5-methoxyuridine(34)/uridine 5-oxyacetic acid(34) synthase CmoB [Puniceicoccaceae bacterium K14]|nr:tRNA 5-methoxyuridine(34)/uridine 5-oxyacetic acid(34) synthase CmoB [Puniceicoccaceae bacterium K14]
MLSYDNLYQLLDNTRLKRWLNFLPQDTHAAIFESNNGNLQTWLDAMEKLPDVEPSSFSLNSDTIKIGEESDLNAEQKANLIAALEIFKPWRKGPFDFFGTYIDSEWQSDWKWNRIKDHLSPLKNRLVLDVGCGNGYHSARIAAEGAQLALGIDPGLKFIMQHKVARKYLPKETPFHILPFPLEGLPTGIKNLNFDTLLCMGVLYHRKSPIEHLYQLKYYMKEGSELLLETLVVDGPLGYSLVPDDRYAKMTNVWFLPSILTLEQWMKRCGFKNIRLVDTNQTSAQEQHPTPWATPESLEHFLDPKDKNKTVEGHPAPLRASIIAEL